MEAGLVEEGTEVVYATASGGFGLGWNDFGLDPALLDELRGQQRARERHRSTRPVWLVDR